MSDMTDPSPAAVERFSVFARHGTMHHDLNGSYVRYSDYAALSALSAAANARADQARDDALVEAADIILADNYDDPDSAADAILALRDKPAETAPQPALCSTSEPQTAPAVTVREAKYPDYCYSTEEWDSTFPWTDRPSR